MTATALVTSPADALLEELAHMPAEERRHRAKLAAQDRRTELAVYADAYAERFGVRRPQLDQLEAEDDLLASLLALTVA